MSAGTSTSISTSDQDASAQTSGNYGNSSSSDRVSKQFNNISGGNSLDLNSYMGMSSNLFYEAIAGEQSLEKPATSNAVKYSVIAAVAVVSLFAVFALSRGRK